MNQELADLKSKISSFKSYPSLSNEILNKFKEKTVVVFMAGGMSSRFTEVSSTQKNIFQLPNGDTMLELAIKMYAKSGFSNFALLVSYQADEIINRIGDGSKYGVSIKYSHDPKDTPVGKGGAIRNALDNSVIPQDFFCIIHNPDDVIVGIDDFPNLLSSNFLYAFQNGFESLVVVVPETPYEFSGMKVVQGEVVQIEMYPKVPIPAHVGITVLSPKVYKYFNELFNYEKKSDFEKVLFPILAQNKKLFAMEIPSESWIPVNNLKSYQRLISLL